MSRRSPKEKKRGAQPGKAQHPVSRLRLLAVVAVAAVGTGAALFLRSRPAQADLRPIAGQNVLLITIDTLRADALGCYGGQAATPALDQLARGGVRFDFAHAHAVLTLPSHASILTGQYPFQHGLRDNSGFRLPADARTSATLLKRAGYATAAFVGAFPVHSRFGLGRGFDLYDDRFGETRAPTEFVMPERPASSVVPLARDWIARQTAAEGQRWFVWVHLFDPHAPYRPPPPFDSQYAGRPYYGEVAATDAALRPLLDDVRASDRPTLVIVTGDHGEALGDHGEQSHGLFAYESTLRIPLLMAEVGGQRRRERGSGGAGEVSSVAARHIDILPTILNAVDQPVPADLPGRTLLPTSERRVGSQARVSYFEAMSAMLNRGWAPLTGVLVDRDKFIDLPIPERYELSQDPAERTNLVGRAPDRDRLLAASLRAYNAAMPGQRLIETPEAVAQLRALGYVSGSAGAKRRYTEADDLKRLVDLDQTMHSAVEAFGAGRVADAARTYRQILDRRPDMAIAYRHLAFLEWQQGNPVVAINVLRRAVQSGVQQPAVLTELAGFLAETGRAAEGIGILEPLANDPEADADTVNTLGIAYARAGRRDAATRQFERVLVTNSKSSIPLENLGMLALERDDIAEAQRRFESAAQADPRSSRAQAGLGLVALRRGDRTAAAEAWERAVQLDPTNFDALYNLGVTLVQDGRIEKARPYLQQFLRTAPQAVYAKDFREVSQLLQRR